MILLTLLAISAFFTALFWAACVLAARADEAIGHWPEGDE